MTIDNGRLPDDDDDDMLPQIDVVQYIFLLKHGLNAVVRKH